MDAHLKKVARRARAEDGATAVEYCVMMAMIILAAFGSIAALGPTVAARLTIPGW